MVASARGHADRGAGAGDLPTELGGALGAADQIGDGLLAADGEDREDVLVGRPTGVRPLAQCEAGAEAWHTDQRDDEEHPLADRLGRQRQPAEREHHVGAISRPRATEMTFWAASAMPSTNRSTWPRLLGVSVNAMETFVVGWHKLDPDVMWGFLNVRTSALEEAYGSVREFVRPRRSWLEVEAADYEAGGGDVTTIRVDNGPSLRELLTEPDGQGVMDAAGSLVLHLMRKGPTVQWRWHNFAPADELAEPLPE